MGVMAVGTFYLALDDRVVRDLVGIGADIPVAAKTDGRLLYRGALRMDGMAGGTLDIICFVLAHVPVHEIF